MRTRREVPIDLIWVLVNLANARASQLVEAARSKNAEHLPRSVLSINMNSAGTQAVVKLASTEVELRARVSAQIQGAIVQVYDDTRLAEVQALVRAPSWTGA